MGCSLKHEGLTDNYKDSAAKKCLQLQESGSRSQKVFFIFKGMIMASLNNRMNLWEDQMNILDRKVIRAKIPPNRNAVELVRTSMNKAVLTLNSLARVATIAMQGT